ncbi:MAG: hypothetical protein PHF21_02620 [Bacilli bacterium]|nr:hypothetical protein [Bacilli bacterium]
MTDLVSVYSKFKIKTLCEYINLISKIISVDRKKILSQKKRATEIYEEIIKIYMKKYIFITEMKYDLSKMFVESSYIDEYSLTKEINAISDYFIKSNIICDLVNNEEEIILIAVYLQMALKLDEIASLTTKNNINYNEDIYALLDKYHKIDYIFLIDQGKKNTKELIELLKNKSNKEKELISTLTNKNSFNKYIKIDKNKDIYITQYNYYIEDLEKFDSNQSQKIYYSKNIDDNYTIISTELALTSIVKQLQSRQKLSTFLIPIKKKFLTKEKNIRDYKRIINTKISSKCIKLLINQNEVNENVINTLKHNKLDYYIYCNKGAVLNTIDNKTKYIFSKEFMKSTEIIIGANDNIVIENINIFMEDQDLISNEERENN